MYEMIISLKEAKRISQKIFRIHISSKMAYIEEIHNNQHYPITKYCGGGKEAIKFKGPYDGCRLYIDI